MATAKDVMSTNFHTLHPDIPINEAVKMFKKASEEEKQNVFGMIVTNQDGRIVGMLSMYDILLYIGDFEESRFYLKSASYKSQVC